MFRIQYHDNYFSLIVFVELYFPKKKNLIYIAPVVPTYIQNIIIQKLSVFVFIVIKYKKQ